MAGCCLPPFLCVLLGLAGIKGVEVPLTKSVRGSVGFGGVAVSSFEAVFREVFSLALAGIPGLSADGPPSFGVRGPWGLPRSVRRRVERMLCGNAAGSVVVARYTLRPSVLGTSCIRGVMMAFMYFMSSAICVWRAMPDAGA